MRLRVRDPFLVHKTALGRARRVEHKASNMHADKQKVFRNTLSNILTLRRFLGSPVAVGISMLLLTFDPDPWATPQQLAELADVSDDTVRRRVNDLVSINRAECKVQHGRHLYRLRPAFAAALVDKLAWDHTILGGVPELPQDAVADCD